MIKKLLLKKSNLFIIILLLFAFSGKIIGQTTSGAAYIWSTTTSWTPTGVPTSSGTVTVNSPLTLDQNLTIDTGNYTFNQDVTDQLGGSNYSFSATSATGSLTVASGTTTIEGGITNISGFSNTNFTLTVKSGATLILGTFGSPANNFNIGDKVAINIELGGSIIVYGNIVNSNSSGSFTVNGLLQVYGNYSTNNGNIDISGATGQFYTTGAMQTQGGSSTIYDSSNDCASNCSGTSLGCGTAGSSYTAIILPQSQTVCAGGAIAEMTFTTNSPSPSYQWEYSLSAGGTYSPVSCATLSRYTPLGLTVTTWYRVKYTSSASNCGTKYSAPVPVYVSGSTYTQSTAGQTICVGVFGPISVSAFGTGLTYQWYSNSNASNSGGTLISGATSNVYTPSSAISGIKYYYCIINSSCGTPFITAVSGAFIVNLNSAGIASSTPTTCVSTLMTNITHSTTNATGIGTVTGLPPGVNASWASNTITISGTPTASGTFNYSIPLTGGCGTVNATGAIIVNPTTVGGIVTGGTTICSGNVSGLLTLSGQTGTIIKWQSSVSPFSTWTDIVNTAATYTSGILSETTKFRAVVQSGSCAAVNSLETSVTVNAAPTAPLVGVGAITQPTCALPSGSVVLSGLPASGTLNQTKGTVVTSSPITGTTMTITGLTSGTYTYTVSNGSCTSGASSNVLINETTNTWNLNAWSNGTPPTINGTQKLVFNSLFTSSADLSGCSCEANGDVNIKTGHTLTLTNELTVVGLANMVFEDGASLVQINNVTNSGKIVYNRDYTSLNTDYTYWSSPVSPQKILDFSPDTIDGMMYSYNSSIDNWQQESLLTIMNAGIGYIVRGPEPTGFPPPPPSTTPQPFTATFRGVPNNGDISIPVTFANPLSLPSTDPNFGVSYLLGNPYPSALDAETFLDDNSGVLEGTIYFWTHITPLGIGVSQPGTGVYAYSGADYAAYNSVGGVGVGLGTGSTSGSTPPSGKIAAGQGFFATCDATGNVLFKNSMRVTGNNSQFFKTKNPSKSSKPSEKNRIWLNLTNTQGAFKQTLVGYITDATNDYDDRFDGESFDGNEFVDFYSVNQDKNLVIQGRALPFDENDEVPIGYRTTINGAFTINIDQVDGFLTNQAVLIEDKLTNTIFDLKSGNYTFNTTAGAFDDRFVLRFKDNSTSKTLAAANFDSFEKTVLVSTKNKQIRIDSAVERIDKVTVFDLLGRQIYQKANVNSNELSITNLLLSHQTLLVKIALQNGNYVTKKIIY